MLLHLHCCHIPFEILCCMKVLWNKNLLQRVGYSSRSSEPVQTHVLLDCKGINFMLCGRTAHWGAVSTPWHHDEETGCHSCHSGCMSKMKTVVLLARHEAVTNLAATSLTFNSQLLRRPSKLAAKALRM